MKAKRLRYSHSAKGLTTLLLTLTCINSQARVEHYSHYSSERPLKAATIFRSCDPALSKPGTSLPSMCAAWDMHLAFLDKQLAVACTSAGEVVHERAFNVPGVYLPKPEGGRTLLHSDDRTAIAWVAPTLGRNYRFVEIDTGRKQIHRQELDDIQPGKMRLKVSYKESSVDKALAEYEVTSSSITDKETEAMGLYGDRTVVRHRASGRVLGKRTSFYYLVKPGMQSMTGQRLTAVGEKRRTLEIYVPCDNYSPINLAGSGGFNKSAYRFASRVAVPPPYSLEQSRLIYGLSIGGGNKTGDCDGTVQLGPGISLQNLTVDIDVTSGTAIELFRSRVRIGIRDHADTLDCSYQGMIFPSAPEINFLFQDGTMMNSDEILEHFGFPTEYAPEKEQ
jgi:hypothetical protein